MTPELARLLENAGASPQSGISYPPVRFTTDSLLQMTAPVKFRKVFCDMCGRKRHCADITIDTERVHSKALRFARQSHPLPATICRRCIKKGKI